MQTKNGEVVLIHHKKKPMGYARVEDIIADVKPGWWQIQLLLLAMPLSRVTWILREAYIDGEEFTMGGDPMRLERLPEPKGVWEEPPPEGKKPPTKPAPLEGGGGESGAKVVSLADRMKHRD